MVHPHPVGAFNYYSNYCLNKKLNSIKISIQTLLEIFTLSTNINCFVMNYPDRNKPAHKLTNQNNIFTV